MIAVAAGHIWWRPGPAHAVIYSFHMPLFFLLAGYVFKPKPMAEFTRKQLIGIALPYLSFLAVLWAFDIWWEGHRSALAGWQGLAKVAYGGTALSGPFTVFWFAPCLLAARLLQNLIAQKWPQPLSWVWAIMALVSLAFGAWLGMAFKQSPLGLLTVPGALFLLWAGWALREAKLPGWVSLAALVPAAGVFLAGWEMNMKAADYGVPFLLMFGAIAISLVIFRIAEWIPAGDIWLAPLGAASLVIMFVHVPVIHYAGGVTGRLGAAGPWAMLPICLGVSYLVWRLLALNRWTASLFLGQKKPAPVRVERSRDTSR